jgi:hypothetical protein
MLNRRSAEEAEALFPEPGSAWSVGGAKEPE